MAAPQPTYQAAQPPPDLPSMPDVSTTLTNYLHNFALWCRNGFADSLRSKSALPGIMLMANDAAPGTTPKVFLIQVNTAGTIIATSIPLGGGP